MMSYPVATTVFKLACFYKLLRGEGRGGPGVPMTPPLGRLLLSKQPTIFRWQKRHDNILAIKANCRKAHFFKICFFVKYFRQRLLSLVNMGVEVDMTIW